MISLHFILKVVTTTPSDKAEGSQGQFHEYAEEAPTISLHPAALQPDGQLQSQAIPASALDSEAPAYTGEFGSGGDPEVYSNAPTIIVPKTTSTTDGGFTPGGDVESTPASGVEDIGQSEAPNRVATDEHVPGAGGVLAVSNPQSTEQRPSTSTEVAIPLSPSKDVSSSSPSITSISDGGAYAHSRKRKSTGGTGASSTYVYSASSLRAR